MAGEEEVIPSVESDGNYSNKLVKSLYDLHKQNQLCDITINVGGRAFHAHKNILAARSSYFLAMFTSGFKETTEKEINIDGKAEIFKELLEFAYTGKLAVRLETACDILQMASYMQFADAQKTCCDFIEEYCRYPRREGNTTVVSINDVVKIRHLAKYLNLPEIVKRSEVYMCCHLQQLKTSEMFFETANEVLLEKLLRQEDFSSEDEEKEVLEMVVNWLKYNWENRRVHASCLLGLVRLGHVPEGKLTELLDKEILEIPECKLLLEQTQEALQSACSKQQRSKQLPNLFATRSTVMAPIHLSPLYSSDITSNCYFSFYDGKSWNKLRKFKSLPYIPSLIVVDDQLYAAGGFSVSREEWDYWSYRTRTITKSLNDFVRYDAELNKWDNLPAMKNYRYNFPLVHLNGYLYAIGGFDKGDKLLNHMERFDMEELYWQRRASLPEGYRWISAVPYQGMVLAYGRKDSTHVIAMYNPDTNVWHTKVKSTVTGVSSDGDAVLFVHRDTCYRVLQQRVRAGSVKNMDYWELEEMRQPLVHKINVQSFSTVLCGSGCCCSNHSKKNTAIRVSIAEEVNQDLIPANKEGAFRIEDKVFVSFQNFIYQTDIMIEEDQSAEVVLDKWQCFNLDRSYSYGGNYSNIALFTVDKKTLGFY